MNRTHLRAPIMAVLFMSVISNAFHLFIDERNDSNFGLVLFWLRSTFSISGLSVCYRQHCDRNLYNDLSYVPSITCLRPAFKSLAFHDEWDICMNWDDSIESWRVNRISEWFGVTSGHSRRFPCEDSSFFFFILLSVCGVCTFSIHPFIFPASSFGARSSTVQLIFFSAIIWWRWPAWIEIKQRIQYGGPRAHIKRMLVSSNVNLTKCHHHFTGTA